MVVNNEINKEKLVYNIAKPFAENLANSILEFCKKARVKNDLIEKLMERVDNIKRDWEPTKIIGNALWVYNIVSNLGVSIDFKLYDFNGVIDSAKIPNYLDEEATKKLLRSISMCFILQRMLKYM